MVIFFSKHHLWALGELILYVIPDGSASGLLPPGVIPENKGLLLGSGSHGRHEVFNVDQIGVRNENGVVMRFRLVPCYFGPSDQD
jgi:hypothetical protein